MIVNNTAHNTVLYALSADMFKRFLTLVAVGLSKLESWASKNIPAPYDITKGIEEKNIALSIVCDIINLKNRIVPKTVEASVKTKPIIPSVEKLKAKPASVGFMPSKTYLPKNREGIKTRIYNIKRIFVDFFIYLSFAKGKFVYILNKILYFTQL